ncbi:MULTISPECIES: DUF6993 domain-containing protein [Subtercola]|uniref:DUF6993 domain-containing protein n=1 Tax=Subtercola vilae TaxID=2056433 RepID=A0A4T2C3N9_9MICO|nr:MULTISPECIES: hypothetical protein [Subtercola]MEA9986212.1 hypothetical protein [Subtercola sp. RTI3]TIH38329.1 hypothetical protein D4765_07065 [Subtercola vilae]
MPRPLFRVGAAFALGAAAVIMFAACTSATPSPAPATTAASTATGAATSAPTAAPVIVPSGTAADNLPYFDHVNTGLIASSTAAGQTPDGKAFTSALRDAGFGIASMQVTPDITTVGVKADSIQFSIAVNGSCLVGQYGFGQYHSLVTPLLGTGKCLIGETRTIDW